MDTWRTLVRVTALVYEGPQPVIYVVVPAWDSEENIRLVDKVPAWFLPFVRPGLRFYAQVNIGAESQDELCFEGFELPGEETDGGGSMTTRDIGGITKVRVEFEGGVSLEFRAEHIYDPPKEDPRSEQPVLVLEEGYDWEGKQAHEKYGDLIRPGLTHIVLDLCVRDYELGGTE